MMTLCRFLSFVASSDLLSTVTSCPLSFITGSSFLSAVSGCFLFFVTSGDLLSAIFGGGPSSSVPLASSRTLFLLCIPTHMHHFSCLPCQFFILLCLFYLFHLLVT